MNGSGAEPRDSWSRPPRIGLVLGAGGVVGGAFHAGVLAGIAEATGWDPRMASVVVGTSAGSVVAAGLRAGLSAADMLARAEDQPMSAEGARLLKDVTAEPRPDVLQPEQGPRRSPSEVARVLQQAARRPLSARPLAILASLVPDGRVDTEFISANIAAFFAEPWPDDPLWICAVRQRDGSRVVFGREAEAPLSLAVAASCAIPGIFRPVTIDGEPYVDGGAHSPTNADLLADAGLDLVLIISPMSMTSRSLRLSADQPARRWSRAFLDAEAMRIRRRGARVVAFQPTEDDLSVIGLRFMDWARRPAVARQARVSTLRRLARADTRQRLSALMSRRRGG